MENTNLEETPALRGSYRDQADDGPELPGPYDDEDDEPGDEEPED